MSVKKTWDAITDIAEFVNSGSSLAVDNVNKSLEAIADLDSEYQSIISLCTESALKKASEIDNIVAAGKPAGRLAGVPFIAKDNFLVMGTETTAASNILKGFIAPYQSTAISKLEAEGAICVAKANLDAFAHGSSTENSDFQVTKNPHDITRVPGGSSGGSAAAVALDLTPFALGTDTGGSIRLPASYCGVVGYKPTYGLVSRSGVVAMGSSTDVVGPLTRSSLDAALVMDVISGKDSMDGTMIDRDEQSYVSAPKKFTGTKIAVIKEYFDGLDQKVAKQIKIGIESMRKDGAEIEEISMASLPLALAVYYVLVPAELSSNLSRYDGQRFGFSSKENSLDDSYLQSRSQGFGDEAKRRIMMGTHVLSSGFYDAYYKKAQIVRTQIMNDFKKAFESYDFLVGPTAPNIAFKIGENTEDPLAMYLTDIMTVAVNLAGVPAVSLPCGEVDSMPIGLQIIANQRADRDLLAVSARFEEITK